MNPFKLLVFFLALAITLIGCSESKTKRPDNATPESSVKILEKEAADSSDLFSNSFDQFTIAVSHQIQSGKEKKLYQAWDFIKVRLFSNQALDNNHYIQARIQKLVGLYADLVEMVEKGSFSKKLKTTVEESLILFEKYYVKDCISESQSNCSRIQTVLGNDAKSISLILKIYSKKEDPYTKLAILGFAFDMSKNNGLRHPQLEKEYSQLVIDMVFNGKKELFEDLPSKIKIQHYRNLEVILKLKDWQNPGEEEIHILKKAKPWLLNSSDKNFIKNIRELLVSDIFIYIEKIPEIKEDLKKVLNNSLKKMTKDRVNLKDYPAYEDIDINDIKSNSTLISLIVIGIYYRDISHLLANNIFKKMKDQGWFLYEFWNKSRLLIRWDMAQLGIKSTKFLSQQLKDQPNKTAEFIQTVLDNSQELNQPWNQFHNQRSANLYNFLDSHRDITPLVKSSDVDDFFLSFDRNIMKTIIYPNMFAFILNMTETEWDGTLNFRLKWGFNVQSNQLFDTMVNGGFYFPWFSFVNLNGKWTYSENTRNSLFRSEVFDALYYFITTKTYLSYGIKLDDFIERMADNLLKNRQENFESVIIAQKRTYFLNDTESREFLKWCNALEKKTDFKERMHYYDLHKRITPFSDPLKSIEGRKLSLNNRLDFYFNDQYTGVGNLLAADVEEMNDQFRMIFIPILEYLDKTRNLTTQLAKKYPNLGIKTLKKTNKKIDYLKRLKKAYLGSQVELATLFQDCRFTAAEESKRRIQQIAFYEKLYLEKVVYSTLSKLRNKEFSRLKARQIMDSFHNFSPAFKDIINIDDDANPTLIYTFSSFSKRVALYLEKGIQFDQFGIKISQPPIVPHLVIEGLGNIGQNTYTNPFIGFRTPDIGRRVIPFVHSQSKESFARAVLSNVMDLQRGKASRKKFTAWDTNDTHPYVFGISSNMEYYATFIQLGKFKHYDFSKTKCRKFKNSDPPSFCTKIKDYNLEDMNRVMGKYFDLIDLNEEDYRYMELIGEDGYYGFEYIDTLAYYDKVLMEKPAVYHRDGRFFHNKLNGFMDFTYQLFEEDYLGDFYKTHFYTSTNSGESSVQCSNYYRDNCRWGWEKSRAEDFYQARAKRQKIFMFKFNENILKEDYQLTRKRIIKKLSYINQIKEKAGQYLRDYRLGKSPYLVTSPKREEYELIPLRASFQESKDQLLHFLESETGGFYKEEPLWSLDYFKWAPTESDQIPVGP